MFSTIIMAMCLSLKKKFCALSSIRNRHLSLIRKINYESCFTVCKIITYVYFLVSEDYNQPLNEIGWTVFKLWRLGNTLEVISKNPMLRHHARQINSSRMAANEGCEQTIYSKVIIYRSGINILPVFRRWLYQTKLIMLN